MDLVTSPVILKNGALLQKSGKGNLTPIIECGDGKLKRIIGATLGWRSMKTARAAIKDIEVRRARRKGQAESAYFGHPRLRGVW